MNKFSDWRVGTVIFKSVFTIPPIPFRIIERDEGYVYLEALADRYGHLVKPYEIADLHNRLGYRIVSLTLIIALRLQGKLTEAVFQELKKYA